MGQENVHYLTEKEEVFANPLIETRMKKKVVKVWVFRANKPEATS